MRDLFVTAVILGSIPYIIKRPWIGVLMWSWISYMNPHRLTWGFAFDMPFAQIIAIVLVLAIVMDKSKKSIPTDTTVMIWGMFLFWITVTSIFAMFPSSAWVLYGKVMKIQFVTFLTMLLITDQKKINYLIWIIVLSIGFFSVKGGVFTLVSGGGYRVWGPPGGYIEENNSLAMATLMIVPLMVYLFQITPSEKKWLRYGIAGAIVLSLLSALGSQSRGALLAALSVSGYFWLVSSRKLITGPLLVFLVILGISFMPDSWHARMETIQHYEQDESAMGRINAWQYAINVASDRFTGGGMQSWKLESFLIYAPNPEFVHAAHSIYFSILGDHGWPGLLLFLLIIFMSWMNLNWVIGHCPETDSAKLAKMIKVSLVAYCTGGAFLSLAYFDLPWHLYAIAVLLRHQNSNNGLVGALNQPRPRFGH
ncbi:MAG: putative O-glycosylation ligase, exosortase A system-associated [Cellvibrionaceae bacterium]|nr:putative O-glycosylation ligase, exosortase A system-associated [Cellvibrionaceae bacterium]|tara:strand:- start:26028 stop:27296 length:1269 start_codon:yes stop_codon:yes gene_type:complete